MVVNIMFLKEAINMRFLCKKDSLNIFNWEIKEDTKTILGYSCQLAVVTLEEGLMKFWFTAASSRCWAMEIW
jgi:GLPGLI family protein